MRWWCILTFPWGKVKKMKSFVPKDLTQCYARKIMPKTQNNVYFSVPLTNWSKECIGVLSQLGWWTLPGPPVPFVNFGAKLEFIGSFLSTLALKTVWVCKSRAQQLTQQNKANLSIKLECKQISEGNNCVVTNFVICQNLSIK